MSTQPLPTLPCLCGTLRRTARALTTFYENALRPLGLRATQFTILQALTLAGREGLPGPRQGEPGRGVSQGRLGEILAIDSTTLTRTLDIMLRRGWIAERRGDDRRVRLLDLAPAGRKLFDRAQPLWQSSQDQVRRQLGGDRWNDLFQLSNQVTNFVANLPHSKGE